MKNLPLPDQELRILDGELTRLDARRAQLLARRSYLQTLLARQPAPPAPWTPTPPAGQPVAGSVELTPPGAQNVLLALGGVLLAIAAIAFTLISWGHLGTGGRSAVLALLTAAALAGPAFLLRRGLTSTAEAVAALALLLTVLDAYALHRSLLPATDAVGFAAVSAGVLAALWAGYGRLLGRLRVPLPAAVVSAQLPLFLWALAAGASPLTTAWALLVTAAADVWAAPRTRPGAVRGGMAVSAWVTACGALLTGGGLSVTAGTPLGAVGPAALLLAGTALALLAGRRQDRTAPALGVLAGLSAVAAGGGVLRAASPDTWAVPGYLLCGVALLAAARGPLPRPVVAGVRCAAAVIVSLAVLWSLPPVAFALLGSARRTLEVWTGSPGSARQALGAGLPWSPHATAPLVLLTAAGALTAAYGRLPRAAADNSADGGGTGKPLRGPALCGAVFLGWAAVLVLPPALDLGYPATLTVPLALTAAALALAVRPRGPLGTALSCTALGCAVTGALSVALLSLATRPATVSVLAVLAALCAGAASATERARTGGDSAAASRLGPRLCQPVLVCCSVGFLTALVVACCAATRRPAEWTALALLVVPAAAAALGARLGRHPAAPPAELSSLAAALLAVVFALGRPSVLALVLALCGVLATATALRPERRRAASLLAAALFVSATWVRLAAAGVSSPEAYTAPVTLPALAVGLLRRRRDPRASSWTAYGGGLAVTFLPSLAAAWGDAQWPRPLLLGLAALAVTLAGARLRLQAPLVLGGAVLALVALHELAPYAVQAVGALPRWLPPALAGLLLLTVGATYEQRLRDARRLRRTLGRMR